MKLDDVLERLRARGYEAEIVSRERVVARVLELAAGADSVGWGGSETLKELGIREAIAATGREIRDHRTDCGLFLLSANALLTDGRIVNIDGTGNRVAASIFGPKRVVYVIGRNKLVEGGIDAAVARIKREACPKNARRLGRHTPCAAGECTDCRSADRMCKVTVVFDAPPSHTPVTVLLMDEAVGY